MRVIAAGPRDPERAELAAAIRAAIARAQPLSDGSRPLARALALLWAAYDEVDEPGDGRAACNSSREEEMR